MVFKVTSEGEKPPSTEEGEEEGSEAEASPSTNTRSAIPTRQSTGMARRSSRHMHMRGGPRPSPTPIVWHEQHRSPVRQHAGESN